MPEVSSQRFAQLFQRTFEKGGRLSKAELGALESAGAAIGNPREKAAATSLLKLLKHDRELDAFEVGSTRKALGVLTGLSSSRLPPELEKVLTHAVPQANVAVKEYALDFDFSKDAPTFPAKAVVTLEKGAPKDAILEVDPERLKIGSVKVDGKAVPFTVKDGRLHVTAPGARAIEINYTVKPQEVASGGAESAYGLIRDKHSGRMWTLTWPYNTGSLFPSNSAPSDGATAKVTVKVGGGKAQAVATGTQDGSTNVYQSAHDAPAYAIAVYAASKGFELGNAGKSRDGVAVSGYGVDTAVPQQVRQEYRETATRSLDFYSSWLGKYDYGPTLKMIEVSGGLGGMEHTSAVAIMLSSAKDPEYAKETAAHETAHHWFGDNVRIKSWNDFWMSEGFTNYATYRFFEHDQGAPKFYELLDRAKGEVRDALVDNPHALSAPPDTDVNEIFDSIPYEMGPWILRMVEAKLGTPKFDALLKDWYQSHREKSVSTEDFVAFTKAKTGTDLSTFFKEWNSITAVPKLDGTVSLAGEKATVSLKAAAKVPSGIEVPLLLEGTAGQRKTVLVKVGEPLAIDAGFKVKKFQWDPERTVLAFVH